ncbi:MAG: biotin-dependent carboxyltransferase family protein, partial [Syntrophobacteraceae bacterium]
MRAIRIIEPGPLATVQDQGRFGFRDRGVPVCGAMDGQALRLANLLAGNGAHAACIEITLGGFEAQFLCDAHFALTGAKTAATCEGRPLSTWETHFAREGQIIQTGPALSGMRTYLAVEGGMDVPELLGSRSTFLRGNLGGFKGRSLRREDLLFLGDPGKTGASFAVFELPAE